VTNQPVVRRSTNLAAIFQELLTAIVRLRANRQSVSDSASFRAHIREALKTADQQTRAQGYSGEDFRLAVLAVVALLDESILNSQNPVFGDWPRQPLQEELFGHHVAGEVFFQNIQRMLALPDSTDLADVLEIYDLCLLLGYGGRYSFGAKGELRAIREAVAAKILRIRGYNPFLAPDWAITAQGVVRRQGDKWLKRLGYAALACCVFVILLFIAFKISLASGARELSSIAGSTR
jgi:type VI secretion system protein ImpK